MWALIGKHHKADNRKLLITALDRHRLHACLTAFCGRAIPEEEEWGRGFIRALLQAKLILHQEETPANLVTMNSRIRLRDVDTGEERVCTLVYPADVEEGTDRVSVLTPLGAALLGSRTGDVLNVSQRGAKRRYSVEDVLYQPEASHHWHL